MKNKQIYTLPHIDVEDKFFEYWEEKPGISFNEVKSMLDIDLLQFKKIGASILINENNGITLDFRYHWIIFNGIPFLTNAGAFILFRECKSVYTKFLRKYERFYGVNQLSMKLNELLDFKRECMQQVLINRKRKRLKLSQLEEETSIYIEYIKEFIPNFNNVNKKALASYKKAKATK